MRLENRKIMLKIVKPAKSGIRKYFMLRHINVLEILRLKMIDSDDFLAGVTSAISSLQCVGAMDIGGYGHRGTGGMLIAEVSFPTLIEKYS